APAPKIDPASANAWRTGASGLSILRLGFLLRIGGALLTSILAFSLEVARARELAVLLVAPPLVTLASSVVMFLGVLGTMSLARVGRATAFAVVALVALAFGVL